jgi:hypothetical protein
MFHLGRGMSDHSAGQTRVNFDGWRSSLAGTGLTRQQSERQAVMPIIAWSDFQYAIARIL